MSVFALAAIVAIEPAAAAALQPLALTSEKGSFAYKVELANNEAAREKGLMNRAEMAADRGMLFDLGEDRVARMWMKNTLIPLDMVFIRANGEVASIAKNAEPMSLAIISSGVRVRAVLELNAGQADKIGLKPGDHVKHKMFKAAAAK
ncbi:MAG: DUF192 domain-containing protein [Caulobacterales bacterium]